MNASSERQKLNGPAWSEQVTGRLRLYLGGRRGWILLAGILVAAGVFFSWGWLVAVGVAPLLVAFAPCAAMCALGLCMNKLGGKSCDRQSSPTEPTNSANGP